MSNKTKEDRWLDGIAKDHGTIDDNYIGIEIVGRIVLKDESDHQVIEEVLEKIREVGSAEITQQVKL